MFYLFACDIIRFSIVQVDRIYYSEILLEKCNYAMKKIKNFISEGLNKDESDDEYDESGKSDEEKEAE